MIKLIVTDLDGTLLNDNHEVPPRFWGIAENLFTKGVKLGIATGRPYFSISEKFGSVMDKIFAISDNGSLVTHENKVLMSKPLPQSAITELVTTARTINDAWPVLCGTDQWYIEDASDTLIESILVYHKKLAVVDDLTKVSEPVLKVSVYDLKGAEQNSYPHYKHLASRLKIAAGAAMWLDITRNDANKGAAVTRLQELYGISPDETLVFGDFMNDYEMMQTARYSYAMKNATPAIIQTANYVTEKDNNDAGILEVIEALCF
ncbi:HAD family hydrolase [Chitinophaga sp. Cy-1792]|uniref:HAD family hydrolase n=1 Tax=Chitinophaga sp. Cy-1792 TaxID=2608339 RepID=UPI0014219F72|nr:HAD family hydrolase [Chitinophaga sp. Cy-1792]NIG54526.1 HAD family phosphatase [Chitinophaga sp. Cy-1792]